MRIHYIQNDPLATLGFIEEWIIEKGHAVTSTRMFENNIFPLIEEVDLLIILGGRMGAYEEEKFPWLGLEKTFIKEAIQEGKLVLGICLGAQMISDVLGGKVFPHEHQEIGWWPIELTDESSRPELFNGIPESFTVFEFHGDTFNLPKGATLLASSSGCRNQAFSYGENVIGLQFHPEFTENMICKMKEKFGLQLPSEKFIQEPDTWDKQGSLTKGAKSVLFTLLNNIESRVLRLNNLS